MNYRKSTTWFLGSAYSITAFPKLMNYSHGYNVNPKRTIILFVLIFYRMSYVSSDDTILIHLFY